MSIDLEWNSLEDSLALSLVEILNRTLSTTERPSFIGPVEVTSLHFGSVPPDIELVALRDIYRDFLEDDEDDLDKEPVKATEGADDEEGFEWVSRTAARREELSYPQMRFGGTPSDMFASSPNLPPNFDMWNSGAPGLSDFRQNFHTPPSVGVHSHSRQAEPSERASEEIQEASPMPKNSLPNLQLHLHIHWRSNLRITLTTSLLINYPSPVFMSLPIKLSIIGLEFTGEIAVAFEGQRKRIHLCILDDLDPYGPAGDRPKRGTNSPPDLDEAPLRPSKPPPIGQRLLPAIYIESEIGQADKHVLKNVTRVEKFIQDVVRKTVEEELVFPNFHTLLMGDQ